MEPFLVIPDEAGRRQSLEGKQCWRIGRGADNDIVIDNQWISRHHALFQKLVSGAVYLVDLGSRNGSHINGQRVIGPMVLADGDRLMLGRVPVEFYWPMTPEDARNRQVDPTHLATQTDLAAATASHEKRLISVLVVDIRGFTVLARTVEVQVLSQAITAFHERAEHAHRRHGSWRSKSTGDGQLAVWAHDDLPSGAAPADPANDIKKTSQTAVALPDSQCIRLLSAVLEIVDITEGLHREFGLPGPVQIGAGVNTGYAVLGEARNTGVPEYPIIGDTVNATFRLESATRTIGADLVIGQSTYERVVPSANGAATDARPPFMRHIVHLKGYNDPQPAYACSFADLRRFIESLD